MRQLPRLVAVRVDDATHAAFHEAARRKGATASSILRDAVRAAVQRAANDVAPSRDRETARA